MLENEYNIDYFIDNHFIKKVCIKCNKAFWTIDENRNTCGDTPCNVYDFIGNPIFNKSYTINNMRDSFINFFKNRNHKHISRYPVVARWRSDIFLTIASIANFQPFVTSGIANPPANPLVISQPCIRLNDIDSVGKTGRHLTTFEMMAHHAFNNTNKEVYWKNNTIEYCNDFLLSLGTKKEAITYIENPWSGGGNAGASVEVMVNGLELATLVFMNLKESENGSILIKNKKYKTMDNYIVDTGYGLERFVWASKGSPTIYDSLFPEILDELSSQSIEVKRDIDDNLQIEIFSTLAKYSSLIDVENSNSWFNLKKNISKKVNIDINKLEQIIEPIQKLYAIVDHTRSLTYMLFDGIIPSNVKSGYLSRLIIRRVLRMMEDIKLNKELSIIDIIKLHLNNISEYKDNNEKLSIIEEILTLEEQKYNNTIINGKKIIRKKIEKEKNISTEQMIELYDSHGITPEITKETVNEYNINIEIPENIYSLISSKHDTLSLKKKKYSSLYNEKIEHLPLTKKMYYDEPERFEFEAVVLDVFDNYIILDSTLFYPEGGGQESDHGTISSGLFCYNVIDVIMINEKILHKIDTNDSGLLINKGDIIVGKVDQYRRMIFTKHHTATHIINDAAKKVLGNHIWQFGSQITMDGARLDVTHYKNITNEELKQIETFANKTIMENKKVYFEILERTEAEQKYGFVLYQGGVPTGKYLRIVKIGTDVEACSGTHCLVTGTIGLIKITKIERIQDGVERIEFKAGEVAIEYIQRNNDLILNSCSLLNISKEYLLKTIEKFFLEWKQQKKEIIKLKMDLSICKYDSIIKNSIKINNINICYYFEKNLELKDLKNLMSFISKKENIICLLYTYKNNVFQYLLYNNLSDSYSFISFNEIIKKLFSNINYISKDYENSIFISYKKIIDNNELESYLLKIKNDYYNILKYYFKNS